MAFQQFDLNYATEYSKAMANAYPYLSYFGNCRILNSFGRLVPCYSCDWITMHLPCSSG